MSDTPLPPSPLDGLNTLELGSAQVALLQRFFEANPLYFEIVNGAPAGPGEALEEITSQLPAGWCFTKKWVIGYQNQAGELVAMANVISDLLAPGVWHIGTFVAASTQHGSGLAQTLYQGLECWARDHGAAWLRLGVVQGNARALRFWKSRGFVQVRTREGYESGQLRHTLSLMYKPLKGGLLESYLNLIPRDRPEPIQAP